MLETEADVEPGITGDASLLLIALLACLLGYGEVGLYLKKEAEDPSSPVHLEGNPYREWIEDYSGEHYQGAVRSGLGAYIEVFFQFVFASWVWVRERDVANLYGYELINLCSRNDRENGAAGSAFRGKAEGMERGVGAVYVVGEKFLG